MIGCGSAGDLLSELSSYVFSPLREGDPMLYRGSGDGLEPVLLATAKDASPSTLRRLEHEFSLKTELDPAWAARPLALSLHNHRWTLVLEDPGGEPLDQSLDKPMGISEFLRIAIRLTIAVRRVHERGLIHRDIKPENVLLNRESGGVWLTGFGMATHLPRVQLAPAAPEVIAGTLAYMAPEQTGRMNRSVDSRSDLYSLGVAFYEMLTGELPFAAANAMEWIHCHIARQAEPPHERTTGIPKVLSSLVMRLLAKAADDRYQTCAGVEADLQRCLLEWQAYGHVENFPLGTRDISDRLLIPEKLYGRKPEIDTLTAAFTRVVAIGATELVLVSGYSGAGKSSIVNELHKSLVPARGLFASGKFDQYKRDIPYSTLAQAFQSIVNSILAQDETALGRWRRDILDALGSNGALMTNLVPALEFIIGEQPPVADLSPTETRERFQTVFRQFVAVFARQEHPLVLFLDDLQWLDTATLELFKVLATHPDVRNLLLIGAFRNNEMNTAGPLKNTLDEIRDTSTPVHDVVIGPLSRADLCEFVSDALHCDVLAAAPLAELMHEKTLGNPFFAIQFLTALCDEHLLVFDAHQTVWKWDLHLIRTREFTDNVTELMAARLGRQPAETLAILQQLACLGNSAAIATLVMVGNRTEVDIHARLSGVVRAGLLVRTDEHYTFAHDRVQESVYGMIDQAARAALHLGIGRLLLDRTPAHLREERVFEIVNQLNRGSALIMSQQERDHLAALNLTAGKRAKAATAYSSASNYLDAGDALLAPDRWDRTQTLAFALAYNRAECAFLIGDLAAAGQQLAALSRQTASLADLAALACLRVAVTMTSGASELAIQICLQCLESLGISWSSRPTDEVVQREYERLTKRMENREIEALIDLPPMTNPTSLATLDVLVALIPAAHWIDGNLYRLTIGRMTNLSLDHGNGSGSCIAYVYLSTVLGPHFGDYQTGHRFGKLALELVETRKLDRFKHRVYALYGQHVLPWMEHLRRARGLVKAAVDTAHDAGDLTFEVFSTMNLATNLLASGDPLDEVERAAERGKALAQKARYGLVAELISGHLRLIRTLRGRTPTFGSFADDRFDENQFEQALDSAPAILACWHWIRKLQARYFAGQAESAIIAAEHAQRLLWTSSSFFEFAEYHFYAALARAACCDAPDPARRPQHFQALLSHHRQIAVWAENCPATFATRAALVSAEIARLDGRDLDALRLYERAILSAREHGFVQNEALAYELAARFCAARDLDEIAQSHLRSASRCYERWGAAGKVRQLEHTFPQLRGEPSPPIPPATVAGSDEYLDLATVIKVSQAVSGELVLEQLIDSLMRAALEHAGAERGLLIAVRGDMQRLEAEAVAGRDTIAVRLRQTSISPAVLPESLLNHVIQRRQSVILDDAMATGGFSTDPYIRRKRIRSVLCLPLIRQNTLIAVLYLENNLTPDVFTPGRIEILTLLASQAAISLESAYLYSELKQAHADLELENSERRRAQDALRRSEAYLAEAQNLSHTGSFGWHPASGKIYWSEESFRIFELDRSTIPTVDILMHQRVHPDDVAGFREVAEQAVRHGHDFSHEYRLRLPDGRSKYIHVVAHAVHNTAGEVEFVGAVMDISAAKKVEERVRNNERELRITIDALPAFVLRTDANGAVDFVSQSILDYSGLSKDDWLGARWMKSAHPEDIERILREWTVAVSAGKPLDVERRVLSASGQYRWFQCRGMPLRDDVGSILKWYLTMHDIEDRKRAEEKLRQSEAYLAEAQALTKTGSWAHNLQSGAFVASPEMMRIFNLDPDSDISRDTVREKLHPDDQHLFNDVLTVKSGYTIDYRLVLADGSIKHIHSVGHPLLDASGVLVERFGTVVDVTERKRAERELRESEEQWRDVFENNPTMYFMVGSGGTILAVNPFGAEHLGYAVDELVGRPVLSILAESDRDAVQGHFAACLKHLGLTHSWEARKVCRDGKTLWVRETGKAVQRASGAIVLLACEDVTERKQVEAEKDRLEAQLRQSQKMEAMGTLAGGIAHDFNNILGAILGYGELAQQALAEGSEMRRYLDNVMQAGGRAKSLVDRILAFSRSGMSELSPINVQAIVEETLELLAATSLAPGVRLEQHLHADGAAIVGDATQLHQVAMNLFTNALQAMDSGGSLCVTLDCEVASQDFQLSHGALSAGSYLRLTVSDTGSGIPPHVLERMFDPFFTTKGAGKGTGLGLSLVHGIVADLGGGIDVRTAVGSGTTFTVWLPSVGEAAAPSSNLTTHLPHGRGQTILIVDNEKPLVALAEETLADLGYEPIGYSSSLIALQAIRDAPQRFDVVLTDDSMPEFTGIDLAREIAQLRPDMPVVLMSGFGGSQLHERARTVGIRELLSKPLQRKDLAECFARLFHNAAPTRP
jgi:PAS domain S-box-containing protein